MFWSSSVLSGRAVAEELVPRRQRPALRLVVGGLAPVGPSALAHSVVGQVALWRRRAIDRAELRRMSRLELRDIRLNPADAWVEANKPFWRS